MARNLILLTDSIKVSFYINKENELNIRNIQTNTTEAIRESKKLSDTRNWIESPNTFIIDQQF